MKNNGRNALQCWVEAMRLRTLPVSVAGVVMAAGVNLALGTFSAAPVALCLVFAVLCQIASNFANEYYDFRSGADRPGREGPRRGVTEGDISPRAMLVATLGVLAAACAVGLSLIYWGGWWLIAVGAAIALGVIAYSAGPFPLSRHGLGEVAVLVFFGLVPVNFTCYLQSGVWTVEALEASVAVGLLGANVIIVNNYRDRDDDKLAGKRTLAVRWGRRPMLWLYIANGWLAGLASAPLWGSLPHLGTYGTVVACAPFIQSLMMADRMRHAQGRALNPFLGKTSIFLLIYAAAYTVAAAVL